MMIATKKGKKRTCIYLPLFFPFFSFSQRTLLPLVVLTFFDLIATEKEEKEEKG